MIFNVEKENWREIGVYRILNSLNGKTYIGSTTTNFRHRYLQYKSGFLRKLDNQPVLYRAFRKHGFENFIFEVVCITSKEETLSVEQSYIDKGSDYNSCLVAGSLQGYKHPADAKTRTVKGGNHHCSKSVDQYTLDGEYIRTFTSIREACEAIGCSRNISSHIVGCCNGVGLTIKGFRWAFAGQKLLNREDKRSLEQNIIKRSLSISKKVEFLCVETGEVKQFNSIKECSISIGVSQVSISNNISGKTQTCFSKTTGNSYKFKLL